MMQRSIPINWANIINLNDFVTKVAPKTPNSFGFARYGSDHYLPTPFCLFNLCEYSRGEVKTYDDALSLMIKKYDLLANTNGYITDNFREFRFDSNEIVEDTRTNNDTLEKFLDSFVEDLFGSLIVDRNNYDLLYQSDIREIIRIIYAESSSDKIELMCDYFRENLIHNRDKILFCILGYRVGDPKGLASELLKLIKPLFLSAVEYSGITSYSTEEVDELVMKICNLVGNLCSQFPEQVVTVLLNTKIIASAHHPELCLAWLQSFDPNYTENGYSIFVSGIYRILRINCPVDVLVYDSFGALAGSIRNDIPIDIEGSSLITYVNQNGEKLVYLPANETFRVELTATGNGTMDLGIHEYSERAGTVTRIVNYFDVGLEEGQVYANYVPALSESDLDSGSVTGSSTVYQSYTPEGESVPADEDLTGNEVASANFYIEAKSSNSALGVVIGYGSFRSGEYAKLTAIPYEDSIFTGWYNEAGDLVSSDTEYRFRVEGDARFVAVIEPAPYHSTTDIKRIAGTSRCATAIAVADAMKKELNVSQFSTIIYTTGLEFADALAGSYLAVNKQAPILLYHASKAEANTQYIKENLAPGGTVYILGGPSSVPSEVEAELAALGATVKRLAGRNRLLTNLEILRETGFSGGQILVCTGYSFADSLAASASGLPILLVDSSSGKLTDTQVDFLKGLSDLSFTIVGGKASVNEAFEEYLRQYGNAERISDSNREKTSIEVAKAFFEKSDQILLAYSRDFPDGLCGGPFFFIGREGKVSWQQYLPVGQHSNPVCHQSVLPDLLETSGGIGCAPETEKCFLSGEKGGHPHWKVLYCR